MKGKMIFRWTLILGFTMQLGLLRAQSTVVSNERYYASSLYNFTRFVKWPENIHAQRFKIAVIGSETVYEELKKITANRLHGQHSFEINYFRKYSEIKDYHHMVFLSTMNSGKINSIKEQVNSKYIMYITERASMGAFGSAISFYVDNTGKTTFELTKNNFTEQELILNSSLLSYAGKVSN